MSTDTAVDLHRYFSDLGRKGGRAGKGTKAAKLRGQIAGKESYFQRLYSEFRRHEDLVAALANEVFQPAAIQRLSSEDQLNILVKAAFRVRDDYQAQVKALMVASNSI